MFNILVESQGLLGTPSNLKLQSPEKRVMAGLIFIIFLTIGQYIGPAGLLRDIDANHMGYMGAFRTSLGVALLAL